MSSGSGFMNRYVECRKELKGINKVAGVQTVTIP